MASTLQVLSLLWLMSCVLPAFGRVVMPGGLTPHDPDSLEIKAIMDQTMAKINQESNKANWVKADEIIEAQSQVVSGIRYVIEVAIRETECPKEKSMAECTTYNDVSHGKSARCKLDIWSQPWVEFLQITSIACVY